MNSALSGPRVCTSFGCERTVMADVRFPHKDKPIPYCGACSKRFELYGYEVRLLEGEQHMTTDAAVTHPLYPERVWNPKTKQWSGEYADPRIEVHIYIDGQCETIIPWDENTHIDVADSVKAILDGR